MEKDVVITYETLYEILRREKLRAELQPLDKNFLKDIVNYLNDKQSIFDSQMKKTSIFSGSETQKTQKQIENIKRMIQELYEKRENKIVQLAVFSSRADEKSDFQGMLEEEKALYEELVSLLNNFRKNVLLNVLSLRAPEIQQKEEPKELKKDDKPNNRLLRFLHATPKFVGDDLKVYGPFEEEDVAALPLKVADILIKNGRAEDVNTK